MSRTHNQRLAIEGRSGLASYLKPYRSRLAFVLALSLVSTGLALYVPYLSKELVDRALLGRDLGSLVRIVGLFAAMTVGSFVLNVASGLQYTRVSADILFDMRLALYRHLQRLSPRFYARTRLGEIVSRINNDIGEVQRVASEAALAWVGNALFLVGTVALMLWLDARLFLVSAAFVPLSVWALARYRRRLEEGVGVVRDRSASIGSFLIETLQGMKAVVTSNAEGREVARFRARNEAFVDALMRMQRVTYLSGGVPGLLLSAGTAAVFLYGGAGVVQGRITLGTFVAFLAYQMRLLPPIQALMGLYTSLATARVSLGRVRELFDTPADIVEPPGAPLLASARGEVAFEDVTLWFDRAAPALEHVSFTVAAGETLAIVGPSGSGKSTIADLLLRLLDPDGGVVRLDGHDLRTLRPADVRRHIALVDQEPFIFHATIGENIRYARPEASDEAIAGAAEAAGLAGFIETLPQRYDTVVGERGMALSAGERQRVAIARALLVDPAVLVLDEATAALDPVTERHIVASYERIMRGRTTIIISHRLHLARQADRILVLDGARLVEQGTPEELWEKAGAFVRLFG